jgi:hypothetical protein
MVIRSALAPDKSLKVKRKMPFPSYSKSDGSLSRMPLIYTDLGAFCTGSLAALATSAGADIRPKPRALKNPRREFMVRYTPLTKGVYNEQTMSLSDLQTIGIIVRNTLEAMRPETMWGNQLDGACAVGAYAVTKLAKKSGFNCRFVLGETEDAGHCWSEVDLNGQTIVVDTTATQFGGHHPKVVLLPRSNYYHDVWPDTTVRAFDASAFRRILTDWPNWQKPTTYRSRLNTRLSF